MAARVTHQSAVVAMTADSTVRVTHQSAVVVFRKRIVGPTILVELTFGETVIRLAETPLELEHYWAPWVELGSIAFRLDYPYGGYFRPAFGGLRIQPPAFKDNWPPPDAGTVRLLMTDSTESAADVILTGDVHLEEITAREASYRIYEDNFDVYALDEAADAAGNLRPVARGFGAREYDGGDGSYTVGELTGPVLRQQFWYSGGAPLAELWNINSGTGYGDTAFNAGDKIYVDNIDASDGGAYYDAGFANVLSVDGSVYEIDWPNNTPYPPPYITADVQLYVEQTLFSAYETGDYTVDAAETPATLISLFEWGCDRLGIALNADRATDAPIARWQSQQLPVIDLLSIAAAFHCHFFRIIDGVCHLVDMEARLPARSLSMILGSAIRLPQPIAAIASQYEEVGVIVPYSEIYAISTNDSETAVSLATADMRQILIVVNSSPVVATLAASMAVGDWIWLIKGGAGTLEVATSAGEYIRTPYDAGTGLTSAKDNTSALWSLIKLVKLTTTEFYAETVGDWDFA